MCTEYVVIDRVVEIAAEISFFQKTLKNTSSTRALLVFHVHCDNTCFCFYHFCLSAIQFTKP